MDVATAGVATGDHEDDNASDDGKAGGIFVLARTSAIGFVLQ